MDVGIAEEIVCLSVTIPAAFLIWWMMHSSLADNVSSGKSALRRALGRSCLPDDIRQMGINIYVLGNNSACLVAAGILARYKEEDREKCRKALSNLLPQESWTWTKDRKTDGS